MLSEKPWKPEAVLVLLLAVGFALVGGALYWQQLQEILGAALGDQTYFDFLALTLVFDVLVLMILWVFLKYHQVGWGTFLGLGHSAMRWRLLLAVAVGLGVLPLALGLNRLCVWVITEVSGIPEQQTAVVMFRESVTLARRIGFGLAAIVGAPVIEEFLFRGVFYPVIKQAGYPRTAMWGTSLMFAAIHFNLMTFVPLTFLALVLVWLYEKTDTLLAPILTHALFNLANFLMLVYETEILQWVETFRQ